MNMIEKAISDCRNKIPREILELAFQRVDYLNRPLPISIDTKIREQVIDARVMVDCDIMGGEQVLIKLDSVLPEWVDPPYSAVYTIPKSLTRGKSITTALSIGYGNMAAAGSAYQAQFNTSAMMDAANQVLQSHLSIPLVSTAAVEMISDNVIFVRDSMSIPQTLWLRCIIENDANMNNYDKRYSLDFAQACVLATKAYIYNTLNIKLDLGQLHGGMNLGKIRDVVDSYSDANELYDTFIEEQWRKQNLMADHETYSRIIKMAVGGGY